MLFRSKDPDYGYNPQVRGNATILVQSGEPVDILFPPATIAASYAMRNIPDEQDLEFNPDTRRLSGTPIGKVGDNFYMDYYAGDSERLQGEYIFPMPNGVHHISVWVNFAPATIKLSDDYKVINVRQGQPIAPVVFPPARFGKDPISYNMRGLPEGLEFNEDTRRLSGTPTGRPTSSRYTSYTRASYEAEDISGVSGDDSDALIFFIINNPVPLGLRPAETTPELGLLDRNTIRKGAWSTDNEARQIDKRKQEIYTFQLDTPTELTIDLTSDDADAYLSLGEYFTAGYSGGRKVSFNSITFRDTYSNDNSGAGTDARLVVELEAGQYHITAIGRTLNKEPSYYTLRISSPDFAPIVETVPSAGRIVARRLDDARIEFAWNVEGGDRVLPRNRYLPARPPTGRWLNSSDIIVEGVSIGNINVRVDADTGRVEFAFTPASGERILPPSRYFPPSAAVNRWLRSTRIEWIE